MLKNKLFAGAIFALGMFVASTAGAAYTFPNQIDTLQEKKDVQTVLNAVVTPSPSLTVDGAMGAKSVAAVKAFQTMKGLTADGKIGPMTRAALEAASVGTTTGTTGTTVAGCPAGAMFNSLTGASCTVASTSTVAGCAAGAAFSSTTGAACTATTPVVTGLTGVSGDIKNFRDLSSYSGQTANEGETKTVYQAEVEADAGSDISLTSVRVALKNFDTGTSSKLLNRYVSEVVVMNGTTKVGSVAASAFTESSNIYTANIPLTGFVVKAGAKAQLTFNVVINAVIDTGDATTNNWAITANSVRFTDASGAISTSTNGTVTLGTSTVVGSVKTFSAKRLSSSSTLKARVSLNGSPTSQVLKVDVSNMTQDQVLARFGIKAEGSDLQLNTLPVKITVSGSGATTSNVVSSVTLSDGTNNLDSVSPTGSSNTEYVTFGSSSNMKYTIAKDATVYFTVKANIKPLTGSTYAAGSTVKVEFESVGTSSADFDNADIRDINQNQIGLTSTNRVGSALGDAMTLRTQGVSANVTSVVLGTANRAQSDNHITDQSVTYRLNVSATGSDYYIPRSVEYVNGAGSAALPTVTGAKGFTLALQNGSDFYPATTEVPLANVSGSVNLISGGVVDSNGLIRITDGVPAVIEVQATLTDTVAASTPAGQYRFGLLSVNANTTSSASGLTSFSTLPYAAFQSSTTGSFTQ